MTLRPAKRSDLPALVDVYNHYVHASPCTFDTEPFDTTTRLPWFEQFGNERHQCWVLDLNGAVCGYACSMSFRTKPAYKTSVEVSVYLSPDITGRGHGRQLYETLFDALRDADVHRAYAGITLPNEASVALHEAFGFKHVGTYTEVGLKFDRYWDVGWWQKNVR